MLRKLIRVWIIGIVFPLYAIAGQPSVKITHGPYLQNLSENEVTVVWTTDKPCKSWVEFSKKEAGKSFYSQLPRKAYASQDGLCCVDTLHRVTITGLEKNTTYFYRVLSPNVNSPGCMSNDNGLGIRGQLSFNLSVWSLQETKTDKNKIKQYRIVRIFCIIPIVIY